MKTKSNFNKEKLKQIKEQYPMAYEPWTSEADIKLKFLYNKGKTITELSEKFERQYGGIRSRLKKLGLIDRNFKEEKEKDIHEVVYDKKNDDKIDKLIDINRDYIQHAHSFNVTIFLAVVSIFAGLFYVIFQNDEFTLTEPIIVLILYLILIFIFKILTTSASLRRETNTLIEKIKKSKDEKAYEIEEKKLLGKIADGLIIGGIVATMAVIIGESVLFSWFIGLIVGVASIFFKKLH